MKKYYILPFAHITNTGYTTLYRAYDLCGDIVADITQWNSDHINLYIRSWILPRHPYIYQMNYNHNDFKMSDVEAAAMSILKEMGHEIISQDRADKLRMML